MEFYNKHYILVDGESRIIDGWSDGPLPDKDTTGALCINEEGGYQFRLFPDGEENPALIDDTGAHLYKFDGGEIIKTTEDEKAAERASWPAPAPTREEQLEAQVAELQKTVNALLGVE